MLHIESEEIGGQRSACGNQFLPSTMWDPETGLKLPGLGASIFTHRAILVALIFQRYFKILFKCSKVCIPELYSNYRATNNSKLKALCFLSWRINIYLKFIQKKISLL